MAGLDHRPHPLDQRFVVNDIPHPVIERLAALFDRQVNVDPYGLTTTFFVAMDADFSLDYSVAHKDMTQAVFGIGEVERVDR